MSLRGRRCAKTRAVRGLSRAKCRSSARWRAVAVHFRSARPLLKHFETRRGRNSGPWGNFANGAELPKLGSDRLSRNGSRPPATDARVNARATAVRTSGLARVAIRTSRVPPANGSMPTMRQSIEDIERMTFWTRTGFTISPQLPTADAAPVEATGGTRL